MSDITIHIDETLDSSSLLALQHDLSQEPGIKNIYAEETKPHLMVVTFDSKITSSEDILASFTSQGLHAELIGL